MRWRSVTRASGLRLSGVWPFRRGCGVGLPGLQRRAEPASGVWRFSCAPKNGRTHSPPSSKAGFQPAKSSASSTFRKFRRGEFLRLCFRPSPYSTQPKRSIGALALLNREENGRRGCGVGLRPTKAGRARLWSLAISPCSQNRQNAQSPIQLGGASSLPSRAPVRLSKVQKGRVSPALLQALRRIRHSRKGRLEHLHCSNARKMDAVVV